MFTPLKLVGFGLFLRRVENQVQAKFTPYCDFSVVFKAAICDSVRGPALNVDHADLCIWIRL